MYNIKELLGEENLTISNAMKKIDGNAYGILFIVDNDGILLGCVTDGDIRRFLLSGGKMDESVTQVFNKSPKIAMSIEEAKLLYHKRDYVVIPVVDAKGRIVDLYTGELGESGLPPRKALDIPVVINAGGKGTRLDPFTRVLPKPLIPVGELPIIELIMQEYQSYSCNDFSIIVNYKRDLIKAYFADNERQYDITWYDEEKPLGTGGGLRLLRGKMRSTFFFANCDALLIANYDSMMKFHRENGNVITMICAYKNVNIPYGVVEMGSNGTFLKLQEKPQITFLTNTGIYIVEPEVIDDIEDDEVIGFPDIVEREKQRGKKVAVYPVSENDWMDMGQIPELENMRARLYGEK